MITMFSCVSALQAATTYNINSNTSWSASLPSYCSNCIINVASGVTLTLNSGMCDNCTFTGGTLNVTGGFSFQSSSISNTTINASTSFNMYNSNSLNNVTLNMSAGSLAPGAWTVSNTTVNFTGSAGLTLNGATTISNSNFTFSNTSSLTANSSLNLSNSTFTFNNSATFTGNSQVTLDASLLYFNGASHMLANSAVSLKNGSKLVAGDGSKTSTAYLYFNSTLNVLDASSYVIISNTSNYFYSWSGVSDGKGHTYSTVVAGNPNYYGPSLLSNSGTLPITVLPVTIGEFSATETNQHAIRLSWMLSDASGRERMEIERSEDATHFSPLAPVAVNGSDASYSYTDESPASGENDYRIKLTGADGSISYSKIISTTIKTTGSIRIFPNPCTNGNFQIQFPSVQSAMIRVFTLDGKLLYMNSVSGQARYAVNIAGAASGMLILQIATAGGTSTFDILNTGR
jgi:hypothetical protein